MPDLSRFTDPKKDAQQFVSDVRWAFTSYYDATRTWRADAYEDEQFIKGGEYQWSETDKQELRRKKRPLLAYNIIGSTLNYVAGAQWNQDTDYRAYPVGAQDEQLGRIMTGLMKYAMTVSSGRHLQHQQFRHGATTGLSVLEVGHTFDLVDDLVEGEIALTLIPELAWYCEVGARRYDRNDAAYQGKLMWLTPEEGMKRWPKNEDAFKRANPLNDWTGQDPRLTGVPEHIFKELYDERTGRVRVLQHWYRVPVMVHLLVNTTTGDVQQMESAEQAEAVIRGIYESAGRQAASAYQIVQAATFSALVNKTTGQSHQFAFPGKAMEALSMLKQQAGKAAADGFDIVSRPTTALRVAHLTGWELLDDKPSPFGSDWRYPFVPFIAYQDTDDYGSIKGLVRDMKDPQKEINWHHATMLDTMVRGPKGGVWIPKGEHVDTEKIRAKISEPGFVGEYMGANPPTPLLPQTIAPGEKDLMQFNLEMAMRIPGVTAEMLGQVTQKTVSGRAIGLRQQGGLLGLASLFANWMETKRLTGELIVRRIQQYYSPEKMQQIIGDDQTMAKQLGLWGIQIPANAATFSTFKQVKDVDMRVTVDFQEVSPSARNAVAQQMLQFKAMGAPIPMELVIEASDMPFKQETLAALKAQGEQPPSEALIKALGAGQGMGSSQPNGVNAG